MGNPTLNPYNFTSPRGEIAQLALKQIGGEGIGSQLRVPSTSVINVPVDGPEAVGRTLTDRS